MYIRNLGNVLIKIESLDGVKVLSKKRKGWDGGLKSGN
jgi:hypothetical protein